MSKSKTCISALQSILNDEITYQEATFYVWDLISRTTYIFLSILLFQNILFQNILLKTLPGE